MSQKVRQLSQKEVEEIDVNDIAYYTLTDGTIVHIKNEGTGRPPKRSYQPKKQLMIKSKQANTYSKYKYQNQNTFSAKNKRVYTSIGKNRTYQQPRSQFMTLNRYRHQYQKNQKNQKKEQSKNEKNSQKKPLVSSRIITRTKRPGNILQPGDNYGYYVSGKQKSLNYSQNQQRQLNNVCTCNNQMLLGSINCNAQLLNGQIVDNQLLDQLNLKYLSLSGNQIINGGVMKKQLYKLVEAIPTTLADVSLMQIQNLKTINCQHNLNNYIIGRSRSQNFRLTNNSILNNSTCTCPIGRSLI